MNVKTWWTPQGFIKGEPPKPWTDAVASAETDWDKMLRDAGYQIRGDYSIEKDFDPLQIRIYLHQSSDQCLVDVSNDYGSLSLFFVTEENVAVFFATWYPGFLRDAAIANYGRELATLTKTLVAYVRHGHGPDTIDEYGHRSYDDWQAEQDRRAAAARKQN